MLCCYQLHHRACNLPDSYKRPERNQSRVLHLANEGVRVCEYMCIKFVLKQGSEVDTSMHCAVPPVTAHMQSEY